MCDQRAFSLPALRLFRIPDLIRLIKPAFDPFDELCNAFHLFSCGMNNLTAGDVLHFFRLQFLHGLFLLFRSAAYFLIQPGFCKLVSPVFTQPRRGMAAGFYAPGLFFMLTYTPEGYIMRL